MYSCLDEAWESPFQKQYDDLAQLYKVKNPESEFQLNRGSDKINHNGIYSVKGADKPLEMSKQGIDHVSFYTSQGEYIPSKKEMVDCDGECQTRKEIKPFDMSPVKKEAEEPDDTPDIFDFMTDDYPDLHPRYEKFCLSKKKKKKYHGKVHFDCEQHINHIAHCDFCQKNLNFLSEGKKDWTDWFRTTETKDVLKVVFIVLIVVLALDILSPLRRLFRRR